MDTSWNMNAGRRREGAYTVVVCLLALLGCIIAYEQVETCGGGCGEGAPPLTGCWLPSPRAGYTPVKRVSGIERHRVTYELRAEGVPAVVTDSVSRTDWATRHWAHASGDSLEPLVELLGPDEVLTSVKVMQRRAAGGCFFHPDPEAPLTNTGASPDDASPARVDHERLEALAPTPFSEQNMTLGEFISVANEGATVLSGFETVPKTLRAMMQPEDFMYYDVRDAELGKEFMWISTEGARTHLHFDNDFNMFVQIMGRKRFVLFPPGDPAMEGAMWPRVHPLWHKSRMGMTAAPGGDCPSGGAAVASACFPDYMAGVNGLVVDLQPGDVLYIPALWWHTTETLSKTSLSVSIWSHDFYWYDEVSSAYKYNYKFDNIMTSSGKEYALRVFLDLLCVEVFKEGAVDFLKRLVKDRYSGLEWMFRSDSAECAGAQEQIPVTQWLLSATYLDVLYVAPFFSDIEDPYVRDLQFGDFVEMVIVGVIGADRTYRFMHDCFILKEQGYRVLDPSTDEARDIFVVS